jgi:hypothetical protein
MDPVQPKQEQVEETANLNSIPLANNTTGSENPENAAANTDAEKNSENAAANTSVDKNPENSADKKSLSIDEAREFTAQLRRGENDLTKAKDPIVLAKETFIELTQNLKAAFANLSIEDQESRKLEVFNAEDHYNKKLVEQKALVKEKRRKDLQEQFAKEEDESASYTAISKGKVWAKLKVGNTECAMVEVQEGRWRVLSSLRCQSG